MNREPNGITKVIKQVSPIEKGWNYFVLVFSEKNRDEEPEVWALPVTGQAVVERTYPDGETATHIEAVVFDDDSFSIASEVYVMYAEGANTATIGLRAPKEKPTATDIKWAVEAFRKKRAKEFSETTL
jgi:hypothetical protein